MQNTEMLHVLQKKYSLFSVFHSKSISFHNFFVPLPSVPGEIGTILALAIISRIAKSVGNSDWYNKHENNK